MSGMTDKRAGLTAEERRSAEAVRSRLSTTTEPKEGIARRAGLGRQTLYALKDAHAGVALRNVVSVARELGIDLARDVLATASEPLPTGPPPSPYDLHNRLQRAEAGLRASERALAALFKRLNVNRPRDPEFDAVLDALAAVLHGLEHARGDRTGELEPEPVPFSMGMTIEEERPENDPYGKPTAVRVYTRDAGERKKVLRAVIRKPSETPDA